MIIFVLFKGFIERIVKMWCIKVGGNIFILFIIFEN